jgi:hypothetical protein
VGLLPEPTTSASAARALCSHLAEGVRVIFAEADEMTIVVALARRHKTLKAYEYTVRLWNAAKS